MAVDIVTGRNKIVQSIISLIPKALRLRLNPRRYSIETFVEDSAKKIKYGALVLDAGAGPCPYKQFFKHTKYEATDFFDTYHCLDFTCNLDKIPKKENNYDYILNTEVLEHVEDPQKVVNEFFRVLKKDGKLFLTTPQSWRIHQAPHNYFYFTKYGLKSLLEKAGFSKIKIKSQGGYFWFLADVIRFNNLLEPLKKKPFFYYLLAITGYPLTQIIIPFLFFHLDFLDKKRDWTMGYNVEAVK